MKKTTAVLLVTAFAAGCVSCAKKNDNKAEDVPEETEQSAEASAETYPENSVVAISEDGPMFPSLAIEIPTTEPAPEYIYDGIDSWIVVDIQNRLMELGFMDWDEPTSYFGEGCQAAVIKFQRQNGLT